MSDSEESTHIVLDSERIIVEVEKRPALYNKELKEYSDRNVKEKLWTEVCANVISKWHELSGAERKDRGRDVQKKWKNLKDCFARELAVQKKTKSGEPAKKRRKYIYFDALLFLLPHQQPRATSSNVEPAGDSEDLPDRNEGLRNDDGELLNDHEGPTNSNQETPRFVPSTKPLQSTPRSRSSKSSHQISLLEILRNKQTEEVSEDKHFALMLIPMLAKLNDEQKHFAKIEILNVMRNAKFYKNSVPQQKDKFPQPGTSTQTNFHPYFHPGPHNMQHQTSVQLPAASPQFSESSVALPASSPQYSKQSDNSSSLHSYYSQFSNNLQSPTTYDSEIYDL